MVAHVLRLRFDLLLGALRGDARHVTRRVIGLVLLVAAVGVVCVGVLRMRTLSDGVVDAVTVVAGSALTLGFFAAALVGAFDDQLDPRRFAVFGASPLRTAGAVLVASVVSVPVLALAAVSVPMVVLSLDRGVPAAAAVASALLVVLTCLLAAKLALAIGSLTLRERRSRELTGVILVALLVVVVPVVVFFASLEWDGRVPPALVEAVDVLGVTPLGAASAIPGAVLTGTAAGPVAVALLTVAALALIWTALVRRLLTTTERPGAIRERAGLGWFNVTPGTPGGAVAARSLIYWLRDARYLVNLVIVPVVAALVVVPLLIVGVPVAYVVLVPAPLMALFFGWLAHNDLAYDSTAVWMHLASAVRGASDRAGRLVPVAVIGTVVLAVSIPLLVAVHGRWLVLPTMIGVCASLFLSGMGLSSIASAAAPYPVTRPGDSPFQQPQRTGGGLAQGIVLVGTLALSAPTLWWGWTALVDPAADAWMPLWSGGVTGIVVLVLGIGLGGLVFDRGGGRLMEFAEST